MILYCMNIYNISKYRIIKQFFFLIEEKYQINLNEIKKKHYNYIVRKRMES